MALVAGPLGRRIFPGPIGDASGDPALMERLRTTVVLDGRKQIAECSNARYAEANWLTRRRSQIYKQSSLGR